MQESLIGQRGSWQVFRLEIIQKVIFVVMQAAKSSKYAYEKQVCTIRGPDASRIAWVKKWKHSLDDSTWFLINSKLIKHDYQLE